MRTIGRVALASFIILAVSLAGCGKKSQPTQPVTGQSSASLVQQANVSLGQVLAHQLDPATPHNRPSDLDLNAPYNLYQQALNADPNNLDAHFGLAVLGLLTLTTDSEVNAAFDEWKTYLQAHTPFELPLPTPGPMGVPARFGRGREVLRLPFNSIPMAAVAISRAALLGGDPQISRVQDILEFRALPRLALALSHLQTIAANPNYQFIVTPAMQGDPSADPVEIDVADIRALRAACGLLAADCDIAIAYQLGFAAYDSSNLVSSLAPGGAWLKLRSGKAARLTEAHTLVLGSVDDVNGAVVALLAETDPQDDDLIKVGPDDLSRADLDSVLANLGNVRNALTVGITLTEDWDHNSLTPPVPLEIHPAAFLQSPVNDWKALLPGYTASAVRRAYSKLSHFGSGLASRSVTIPSTGYYYASYSYNSYPGRAPEEYSYGDPALIAAMRLVIQARLVIAQGEPNFAGEFYGSVYLSQSLSAGTQSIPFNWENWYYTSTRDVAVPVITWNASTFGAWQFPDPTFHGLLPGIASTSALWSTFGASSAGWQQVLVLDWTSPY